MPKSKILPEQIARAREMAASGEFTQTQIANHLGVDKSRISRLLSGESFRSRDAKSGTASIRAIPMKDLYPDPEQPRKLFDIDAIAELAGSIRENGLLQPITVKSDGKGRFVVIAGDRRYRAHLHMEAPTILARIVEMDQTATKVAQIVENLQRRDVTQLEEANAYQALLDSTGWDVAHLAKKIGINQSWRITERTSLLRLEPEYQQLLANGNIAPSQAFEMSKLSPRGQASLFRAVKSGQCQTYVALRAVSVALAEADAQGSMFAAPQSEPTPEERAAHSRLERKIDLACQILAAGFDDNELVAARKIDPSNLGTYADKLTLIQRHLGQMERSLRAGAAQADFLAA